MTAFELRVAITAEDFDKLVAFYRDGLGLNLGDMWQEHGHGQVFHAGRGTIEVLDTEHSAFVDQIEVGQRVTGQIRFALQVPDLQLALGKAIKYGAKLIHEPILTPWNDLNARIESPDGIQVTLFQVQPTDESGSQ